MITFMGFLCAVIVVCVLLIIVTIATGAISILVTIAPILLVAIFVKKLFFNNKKGGK